MSFGAIAALICIVLGFVVGVTEEKILFDSLTWFVAVIAFVLALGGVGPVLGNKQQ